MVLAQILKSNVSTFEDHIYDIQGVTALTHSNIFISTSTQVQYTILHILYYYHALT